MSNSRLTDAFCWKRVYNIDNMILKIMRILIYNKQ